MSYLSSFLKALLSTVLLVVRFWLLCCFCFVLFSFSVWVSSYCHSAIEWQKRLRYFISPLKPGVHSQCLYLLFVPFFLVAFRIFSLTFEVWLCVTLCSVNSLLFFLSYPSQIPVSQIITLSLLPHGFVHFRYSDSFFFFLYTCLEVVVADSSPDSLCCLYLYYFFILLTILLTSGFLFVF